MENHFLGPRTLFHTGKCVCELTRLVHVIALLQFVRNALWASRWRFYPLKSNTSAFIRQKIHHLYLRVVQRQCRVMFVKTLRITYEPSAPLNAPCGILLSINGMPTELQSSPSPAGLSGWICVLMHSFWSLSHKLYTTRDHTPHFLTIEFQRLTRLCRVRFWNGMKQEVLCRV